MFEKLDELLPHFARKDLTSEMFQHRSTKPAKRVIQENYPMIKLELQDDIKDTIDGYIYRFFLMLKLKCFT